MSSQIDEWETSNFSPHRVQSCIHPVQPVRAQPELQSAVFGSLYVAFILHAPSQLQNGSGR